MLPPFHHRVSNMSKGNLSRRAFVASMAGSAATFTIVPRHVLGGTGYVAPSDRVNLAVIGAGSQGMSNAGAALMGDNNLVTMADIDFGFVDRQIAGGGDSEARVRLRNAYSSATRYIDYRQMLERERNNIDAVIIATPDHQHAVQAKAAMELGKAVYVQKPLTWSVREARELNDVARRTGVVTAMGNQGHSHDGTRRIRELIQANVIGPVSQVHVWTNRPVWPQGIPRPTTQALRAATANPSVLPPQGAGGGGGQAQMLPQPQLTWENLRNIQQSLALSMAASNHTVPSGLNWDLFIGPAPMVPYHPIYHPFNWRGWFDWGVGALGDMGAHLLDQPVFALDLGFPTAIEATSSPFGMDVDETPATWPQASRVWYEFAARGNAPAVNMHWYDGGLMPPRPPHLPDDISLQRAGGGIFVGTRGILVYGEYGANPTVFPESLRPEADRVPETVERIPGSSGGHILHWANAVRGLNKPSSPFEYAAPLTETMLLGMVALMTGQGRKINYDGANMRITNIPEANHLLHREYRAGWTL
jgi:predicted dehydrogenase